ncbi:hypothetical protein SCB71_14875 [Herbiconiux sp. KACC 21604]|uniref:hypothetical protein n=1 Tax=unclassified Herbiconiux TaxID=2618217 RepID=UPI00149285CC|nr:hypothetical protein [Herbiconiux sp. SALV-R1]QJU54422.1 hypothetical protein HL652_12815 [Herbiconiux sp. SALV-R1]WPO85496.1 hypothetical protein SCB71_14875 [Herbiconiux sp. KACC 21604]
MTEQSSTVPARGRPELRRRPRRPRALVALLATLAVMGGLLTAFVPLTASSASAATGGDFQAGNIISDAKFYNGQAMNAQAVQNFLNGQVPNCRAGYTCLKDYRVNTFSRGADPMCNAYSGAGAETAAQIIAKVGQACGISQAVLLVLLQKEQSLVTDTWPSATQYERATGFACPDTAPCDSEYFGFYNQVYKAAWQFKRYGNPPGTSNFFTWYPVGGYANVLYNPNAACGSSRVLIQNRATAALYYYTPYQPNAAALANLYGTGDGCSAYGNRNFWRLYTDWFGSTTEINHNPFGSIDGATADLKTVTLRGWAQDLDTRNPIQVYVWSGGNYLTGSFAGAFTANGSRPDVDKVYGNGANHGFSISLPATGKPTQYCLYAINVGAGENEPLGCPTVSPPTGSPIGAIEYYKQTGASLQISGWALDPDTASSIKVQISVNGKDAGTFDANIGRADLGQKYPSYGSAHAWTVTKLAVPIGTNKVCVTAIDLKGGNGNSSLGCVTTTSTAGPPTGGFERADPAPGGVRVSGWAVDLDTTGPVQINIAVNGWLKSITTADKNRPDVGRYLPGYGDAHGYDVVAPASPGVNTICVYAMDTGGNGNTLLGCSTVTVMAGKPIGYLETARSVDGGVAVTGWAIDPDTTAPISVVFYVDDRWTSATKADQVRGDVAYVFPGYGGGHGFSATVPVKAGTHKVCAYAVNTPSSDDNPQIGCATLAVDGGKPVGSFDTATAVDGGIKVSGWTLDPDTTDPIDVVFYVDNAWTSRLKADKSRPDVASLYPGFGDKHGFTGTVPASPGSHRICAYGVNVPSSDNNPQLGCFTVTVKSSAALGALDSAEPVAEGVTVQGWAADPDSAEPVEVVFYVDDVYAASTLAELSRADVAEANPGLGDAVGYSATVPVTPGEHRVCAYAAPAASSPSSEEASSDGAAPEVAPADDARLGCTTVIV